VKRNIKVCCDAMLRAIGHRDVVVTEEYSRISNKFPFKLTIRERSGTAINCCPWCGGKLPFEHEEENDG